MRILVAEDDAFARQIFERALRKAGHEVTAVENGALALEAFQDAPVPLIITDWVMPKMNGIDLTRRVRERRDLAAPHVVVVSSLSPSEHMLQALRAGADDFLGKPLESVDLIERVVAAERTMLRHEEVALRKALDVCQGVVGPTDLALLEALGAMVTVYRKQRAYVRCRAFLRRQIEVAERAFGPDAPRPLQLRAELQELKSLEEAI